MVERHALIRQEIKFKCYFFFKGENPQTFYLKIALSVPCVFSIWPKKSLMSEISSLLIAKLMCWLAPVGGHPMLCGLNPGRVWPGACARAGEPVGDCCCCTARGQPVKVLTRSALSCWVSPPSATVFLLGDSYFKHLNWCKFGLLLLITIRKTSQKIPVVASSLDVSNV